jgi:TonB-dependent SusC/RagA subfamily outer membrane receptor
MKITIPKPCHENWEAMTPDEKGRFCSVCSKTVRDFTDASDDEMIRAFSDPSEDICGNFRESQLNRDLQYSYINSLFTKFAVGLMLTTGGFVSLQAQQHAADTLRPEKIEEVVLTGFHTKKVNSMVTGGGTLICEDQLTNAQKEKEALSALQGVLGKPALKNRSEKQLRIGGATTSLREDQKPLTILDGKIISLEELQKTDPESIETLNILKDAKATALYGSKGINGVILVTTKKKSKRK